jgi:hypothetical protein
MKWTIGKKRKEKRQAPVAHTCNPNYCGSRPAQATKK